MSDGDYEDYLEELGWLSHTPLPPYPRASFIGETVYAEEWAELMKKPAEYGYRAPNSMLAMILEDHPTKLTQRHATICATVVCWLGTNCGQAIRLNAKRLITMGQDRRAAYLMAWAVQNARVACVNHGLTALEHLLAPPDHYGKDYTGLGGMRVVRRPELTVDDHEVVEHLMTWLGRSEGFELRCERRIEQLERFERARQAAEHRALMEKIHGTRS